MTVRQRLVTPDGGRPVLVKSATAGPDADRLGHEAALLALAAHPGVVRVVADRERDDGGRELELAIAGARTAADLDADLVGVAGLVAALATTVADLHDLGVVHGRIAAEHVVIDRAGRPVLCGLAGAAPVGVVPWGGTVPLQPADDVAALGQLLARLVEQAAGSGDAGRLWGWRRGSTQLGAIADAAVAADPPTAAELAEAVLAAVPAARLPGLVAAAAPAGRWAGVLRWLGLDHFDGPEPVAARPGGGPVLRRRPPPVGAGRTGRLVASAGPDPVVPSVGPVVGGPGAPVSSAGGRVARLRPVAAGAGRARPGQGGRPGGVAGRAGAGVGQAPPPGPSVNGAGRIGRLGSVRAGTSAGPPTASPRRASPRRNRPLVAVPAPAGPDGHARGRRHAFVPVLAVVGLGLLAFGVGGLLRPSGPVAAPSASRGAATTPPPAPAAESVPSVDSAAGGVIEVGGARYAVGDPGDVLAVGDWDCDGVATVAVVRPSTGEIFVFDGWATADQVTTATLAAEVPGAASAAGVDPDGDGCPTLVVTDAAGATTEVPA